MNKTVANSVWASRLLHTDSLSEKQMFAWVSRLLHTARTIRELRSSASECCSSSLRAVVVFLLVVLEHQPFLCILSVQLAGVRFVITPEAFFIV